MCTLINILGISSATIFNFMNKIYIYKFGFKIKFNEVNQHIFEILLIFIIL